MQTFYAAYVAIGFSSLVLVVCLLFLPPMLTDVAVFRDEIMDDVEQFKRTTKDLWIVMAELKADPAQQNLIMQAGQSIFRHRRASPPSKCVCNPRNTCPPGPPGPVGPVGVDGSKGIPGNAGKPGVNWSGKIETGTSSPIVVPGGQGTPGADGPPGPAGSKGPPGQPGPIGGLGKAGPDGPPGPAGPDGSAGKKGPKGSPGKDSAGGKGPKGQKGSAGKSGTVGAKGQPGKGLGGAGKPGPDGPPGPPGPASKPGGAGPIGPPGKPGEPGQDGQYCACPPRTSLSKGAFFVAQRFRDIQALNRAAAA